MSEENTLWPGEKRYQELGFPFVALFDLVDRHAPTLVLIPGKFALARVFYGGHEGYNPRDFLAYWAKEAGYNVLAISYPIYGPEGVFDNPSPDMTTQAWGRGAATITNKVMKENDVSGPVILSAWSMGGKSVQPFASEARKIGLNLSFFSGLAATPPLYGQYATAPLSETLFDEVCQVKQPDGAPFLKRGMKIAAKDNGREVIPKDAEKHYLGSSPAQLGGAGFRYIEDKGVYEDRWADMQDNRGFDFKAYPICAPIIPNLQFDPRHGLTDEHAWGVYTVTRLFQLAGPPSQFMSMQPEAFTALKSLVRSAPNTLAREVKGDHFFLIGEKGAKATVQAITEQYDQVNALKQKFAEIIGQPLETINF